MSSRRAGRRLLPATLAAVLLAAGPAGCAAPAPSEYRLPFTGTHPIMQGVYRVAPNGDCTSGCATHSAAAMRYAFDFALPDDTEVLAARAGRVALVQGSWPADHCGRLAGQDPSAGDEVVGATLGNEANFVEIDHLDGTAALYLHLSSVDPAIEAKAKSNGEVARGEVLGRSGRTGWTRCVPHLHFQVQPMVRADWFTDSLPMTFGDPDVVDRTADGVPAQGESYLSGNSPVAAAG